MNRGLGGLVALFALLAISSTGAAIPATIHGSAGVDIAPASSSTDVSSVKRPGSPHKGLCADGAIDAFEDDHPSCDSLEAGCLQGTESPARCSPRVERFVSADLSCAHLARGPPSA